MRCSAPPTASFSRPRTSSPTSGCSNGTTAQARCRQSPVPAEIDRRRRKARLRRSSPSGPRERSSAVRRTSRSAIERFAPGPTASRTGRCGLLEEAATHALGDGGTAGAVRATSDRRPRGIGGRGVPPLRCRTPRRAAGGGPDQPMDGRMDRASTVNPRWDGGLWPVPGPDTQPGLRRALGVVARGRAPALGPRRTDPLPDLPAVREAVLRVPRGAPLAVAGRNTWPVGGSSVRTTPKLSPSWDVSRDKFGTTFDVSRTYSQ
jgi:hypothetical protein